MNRIFYYNIIYRCNLKCKFCFSTSTSPTGKIMETKKIITSLHQKSADANDLIVINGGEPTIHPLFYDLITKLNEEFLSEITVYTNGSLLVIPKVINSPKTTFIIPIHGFKHIHNAITQNSYSYSNTIQNLKLLTKFGYKYRLKFIINCSMISECFDIYDFISQYGLNPEEIILARLNTTKKSIESGFEIPTEKQFLPYLQLQINHLLNNYKIKLLDIPPCLLNDYSLIGGQYNIPIFYFNDPYNVMQKRHYYKEIMIGTNCNDCLYYKQCKLMEKSYLTLSIKNNDLVLERE